METQDRKIVNMNPLKVAYKNNKAVASAKNAAFEEWSKELLNETISHDIKKAEKKYGKNLDHLRAKYNVK